MLGGEFLLGGHSGEVGFMRNQEEKMKILKTSNSVIGFVYLPNIGEEKNSLEIPWYDMVWWCFPIYVCGVLWLVGNLWPGIER